MLITKMMMACFVLMFISHIQMFWLVFETDYKHVASKVFFPTNWELLHQSLKIPDCKDNVYLVLQPQLISPWLMVNAQRIFCTNKSLIKLS